MPDSRRTRLLWSGASCLSSGRPRVLQSGSCLDASIAYSLHMVYASQSAAHQVAMQSCNIEEGEANRHGPHFHHGPLELATLLALVTLLMAVAIHLLLKHGFHSCLEVRVSFL